MSRSRQLAAVMFTDIQGYTALMQQNEQQALRARDKHRRIFNAATEKYHGKTLQYYGDGTLSIFDSAFEAVQCAVEMQLGFRENPLIPVRIGIHTGEIFFSEEEIVGDSVNIASRIESLAVPGSVFISEKVYSEIKNQESIQTVRLNAFHLKNIEQPVVVYAVANAGLVVPALEEISGKTTPSATPGTGTSTAGTKQQQTGIPLLATKLYIPPPRPKAVHRHRLVDRLNAGLGGKLTLLSAPAGFGKTTLVSEWIAACDRPVAWLSLDDKDGELFRFLAYLVAALQKVEEHFGTNVLELLHSPQPPPTEPLLTALLNEIAAIPQPFLLVLDDYHLIDSRPVDEALTFLLDHLPPQMQLVITTREDPLLPLARLRVRGQMTEIRAADLRFSSAEAAGFLHQVMGLSLSQENVAALENRTEGWIAGLQMAALSLQGRADRATFIRAFTGSHHFIVDYLVEEVLLQQPAAVRSFLLHTALLDRLSGDLCDAVTGQENGNEMLEALERGNLFVVPLDDRRQWYRYHHLFGDVLQARAKKEYPDQLPVLHRRASAWFEKQGARADAIRHALAATDYERAAALIELAWPEMDENFQTGTWMDWLQGLPEAMITVRPVLLGGQAWALLNDGKMEAGEAFLQQAERWLDQADGEERLPAPAEEMVVVDQMQYQHLPASIATAHAYIALSKGEIGKAVDHARKALDLVPADDLLRRGPAAALLGLSAWASGDLEEAQRALVNAMEDFREAGTLLFSISGTSFIADILRVQGRLREAFRLHKRALDLVQENGQPLLTGTADLYLGLSVLCLDQGDFSSAEQHLHKSEELGQKAALPDWEYRLCLGKARLNEMKGEMEEALVLLDRAENLYYPTPIPVVRPIPAWRARLWIRQGRLEEAWKWARDQQLSAADELHFLREFEHVTLARLLLAQYDVDRQAPTIQEAMPFLERLRKAAKTGKRAGSAIEVLVLQSLAQEALGNLQKGLVLLQEAIQLAEPEGYVSIFTQEGEAMARLLSKALSREIVPAFTRRLLASMAPDVQQMEQQVVAASTLPVQPLLDPLSPRELEILQLVAEGLSNREISERLFLALSTIKGHNRKIFDKLEVKRRTEAVARARELGLL